MFLTLAKQHYLLENCISLQHCFAYFKFLYLKFLQKDQSTVYGFLCYNLFSTCELD